MTLETPRHTDPAADVAIVGMACVFPGADSLSRFWQNIVNKVDCVTDPPPSWRPERYCGTDGQASEPVYTGKGGYLGDLCRFNPAKYGVMPSSLDGAEPDQFLALRCAHEALLDAGVPELPLNRAKTGIILGRGLYHNRGLFTWIYHGVVVDQVIDLLRQIEPDRSEEDLAFIRGDLKRNLPPFNAETVPGLAHCVLAGRIANRLDLNGPTYTLDAACASTLIAVEHALRELRAGRCDAVIAGGVQVTTPVVLHQLFCRIEGLSRTGKIAPFSAQANGTLLGEGCGMLVLKRQADAERDGNRIYALLKAVGVSSDGKGAGLLAPQTEGQQLAIRRAYEQCGVPPSSIALLEAHGTGMPLGDQTEIRSITACFGSRGSEKPRIALGSVKSMIGHLIPASGAASLIKTALALYHRVLPPTLHGEDASPRVGLEQSPCYLSTTTRPWVHGDPETPRRAGVNAFGFGGVNAHAVLEEHGGANETTLRRLETDWPAELVVVSAKDPQALHNRVAVLVAWLQRTEGVRLLDVAASCAQENGECRLAVVASSIEEVVKKLTHAAKLLEQPDRKQIQDRSGIFWYREPLARSGRVAFVFPGEGAQYPNMLLDLCRHFPEVRREFDRTDAALRDLLPQPLSRDIFPPAEEAEKAEGELLGLEGAVASVTTAGRAVFTLLMRLGVRPAAMVGHSSGEFGALLAAGAFDLPDEAALLTWTAQGAACAANVARSGLAPDVVLTAVGGVEASAVRQALDSSGGRLAVAMDNCPHQQVLAGNEEATAAALEQLRGKGGLCERLAWGRAYHTEAFAPACALLDDCYRTMRLGVPNVELWSCATAARFPADATGVRELAVRQWRSRVRFRETVQAMYEAGYRVFVEVGPRGNLSAFIDDTLGKEPHAAVPMDVARRGGLEQLCRAVGQLVAHGVPVSLPALYSPRRPRLLDLNVDPPAPAPADPVLNQALPELRLSESVVARLREPHRGDRSAMREAVKPTAVGSANATAARPTADPRQRVLADFQQTMQVFLTTQEQAARARFGVSAPTGLAEQLHCSIEEPTTFAADDRPALLVETPEEPAAAGRRLPFLENVLVHEPGHRLVAECELDPERHRFLLDHTFFGRHVSDRDLTLTALPVMPLAASLELMAEAAVALCTGLSVVAVRDVQTMRWLAFETASRRVRMEATMQGENEVRVALFEADREGMSAAVAEATFELSAMDPELGPPSVPDQATTPFPWPQDEVYGRILFHGPAFEGVVTMDSCERNATRSTLREPDPALIDPASGGRDLILPVALMDLCGQISGITVRHSWTEGEVQLTFPNRIGRLEFVRRRDREKPLRAVVRVEHEGTKVLSDVEMQTEDGEVILRATGRVEELARIPADLYACWRDPRAIRLSRVLKDIFRDVPGADRISVCAAGNVAGKALVSRLWAQALARMILSAEERRGFFNLKLPPVPAAAWLLGRMVAKDAVRARTGLAVCMADVEVLAEPTGRPFIRLAAGAAPLVSLAHKGFDAAVAVAADADAFSGVGIDLEPLAPLDAGVLNDAFTSGERSLAEQAARAGNGTANDWLLSFWAGKEAAGKALGRGVLGGPRNTEVVQIEPTTGRMSLVLHGSMAEAFPESGAGRRPLQAHGRKHQGYVLALCLLPRTFP